MFFSVWALVPLFLLSMLDPSALSKLDQCRNPAERGMSVSVSDQTIRVLLSGWSWTSSWGRRSSLVSSCTWPESTTLTLFPFRFAAFLLPEVSIPAPLVALISFLWTHAGGTVVFVLTVDLCVTLQIKNGQVCLGYDLGHGNISDCVPLSINDGSWHKVRPPVALFVFMSPTLHLNQGSFLINNRFPYWRWAFTKKIKQLSGFSMNCSGLMQQYCWL